MRLYPEGNAANENPHGGTGGKLYPVPESNRRPKR